VFRMTGCV